MNVKTAAKQVCLYFICSHLILYPESPIAQWWDCACPVSNWEVMGLIPAMRRGGAGLHVYISSISSWNIYVHVLQFFLKKKMLFNKHTLGESILYPCRTNIWSTIIKHTVCFPSMKFFIYQLEMERDLINFKVCQ